MIDFHSHILPNVDDGSKSVEETFELLEEAKNAGFEGVISTSHYMEEYYEVNVAERKVWINALAENLYKKNIDLKLYLGNEIYFTENLINLLETGKATSINNSNYLVHDGNLVAIINELKVAGAEAISINGKRIVNSTSINCAGNVIQINGEKVGSPFVINAIGDKDLLYGELTKNGGTLYKLKKYGVLTSIKKEDSIEIEKEI